MPESPLLFNQNDPNDDIFLQYKVNYVEPVRSNLSTPPEGWSTIHHEILVFVDFFQSLSPPLSINIAFGIIRLEWTEHSTSADTFLSTHTFMAAVHRRARSLIPTIGKRRGTGQNSQIRGHLGIFTASLIGTRDQAKYICWSVQYIIMAFSTPGPLVACTPRRLKAFPFCLTLLADQRQLSYDAQQNHLTVTFSVCHAAICCCWGWDCVHALYLATNSDRERGSVPKSAKSCACAWTPRDITIGAQLQWQLCHQ